jgi:hypothetical protein
MLCASTLNQGRMSRDLFIRNWPPSTRLLNES